MDEGCSPKSSNNTRDRGNAIVNLESNGILDRFCTSTSYTCSARSLRCPGSAFVMTDRGVDVPEMSINDRSALSKDIEED